MPDTSAWKRVEPMTSAIAILEKRRGRGDPLVGEALSELANLKRLQADYDSAETLYRRALGIVWQAPQPDSLRLAMDLGALANVLVGAGKLDAADSAMSEALAIERRPRRAWASSPAHSIWPDRLRRPSRYLPKLWKCGGAGLESMLPKRWGP
ncbi:MAG: tetratricopeptide repeat protein [Gemmatimonadales bacterium]